MPVGDEHLGRTPVIALQVARRGVERLQRGEVVHVADVRRQPGVAPVADAERVLQVAADRQRRRGPATGSATGSGA